MTNDETNEGGLLRPPAAVGSSKVLVTLQTLPKEVESLILKLLSKPTLARLSQVSTSFYKKTVPLLWEHVELVDCSSQVPIGGLHATDEHDDKRLLIKLGILATRPYLAAQVKTLTHRCHLPTPEVIHELPRVSFESSGLSADPRISFLVHAAAAHMTNVRTLRIIFGHWHLTRSLLRAFLGCEDRQSSVRRLWLESCSISSCFDLYMGTVDLSNLESVRMRRMKLRDHCPNAWSTAPETDWQEREYARTRTLRRTAIQDGWGGVQFASTLYCHAFPEDNELAYDQIRIFTKRNFAALFEVVPAAEILLRHSPVSEPLEDLFTWQEMDSLYMSTILDSAQNNLTSLTFDWVFMFNWTEMLYELSHLTFPKLRAFQFRNAVVEKSFQHHRTKATNMIPGTTLAPGMYLLEPGEDESSAPVLAFLERHPRLQCLAWPMDRFFSLEKPSSKELQTRADRVMIELARNLLDLRVDASCPLPGDLDNDPDVQQVAADNKFRRRRFIAEFAVRLIKLRSIKVEGDVPKEEMKEILRALDTCPLQKIVLVALHCPIGNTWGRDAIYLDSLQQVDPRFKTPNLAGENKIATFLSMQSAPAKPRVEHGYFASESDAVPAFTGCYRWGLSPPMLHTIAAYYKDTITQLKLCGDDGAPVLENPAPITSPMLAPLQAFDGLRKLHLRVKLLTVYNGIPMDTNIINWWRRARAGAYGRVFTTAGAERWSRADVTAALELREHDTDNLGFFLRFPTVQPQVYGQWDVRFDARIVAWVHRLRSEFSKKALTRQVVTLLGPHLSDVAKQRPGGVTVRTCFALGHPVPIPFELEMAIAMDQDGRDYALNVVGPRTEHEHDRRVEKLENRAWF